MRREYNLKTLGPRAAQLVVELNERRQSIFSLADVTDITDIPASPMMEIMALSSHRVSTCLLDEIGNPIQLRVR